MSDELHTTCGCPHGQQCEPRQSVTWRRGEADGRNGHPPAEIDVEYLRGYAAGLENRP